MLASTSCPNSRHLFESWRSIAVRLKRAKHIALFLDFDGTLAPLRNHPEEAEISQAARRLLRRLARHPRLRVYVISGRRAADVHQRVGVPGVSCIGLHGGEREGRLPLKPETLNVLERARRRLEVRLAGWEGLWVEDKFASFVVHYELARPEAVRKARAVIREVLRPLGSRVWVLRGKNVWEILPREIKGKGAEVRGVLSELAWPAVPIYIGDDVTDESAFAALPRGLTIRVGPPRRTRARFELRNPEEVREFLEKLEAEIA